MNVGLRGHLHAAELGGATAEMQMRELESIPVVIEPVEPHGYPLDVSQRHLFQISVLSLVTSVQRNVLVLHNVANGKELQDGGVWVDG